MEIKKLMVKIYLTGLYSGWVPSRESSTKISTEILTEPLLKPGLPNLYLHIKNKFIKIPIATQGPLEFPQPIRTDVIIS